MDNNDQTNPIATVHIPLALLSLALCFLFFLQIKGTGQTSETMIWQKENAEKQIGILKENHEKLTKAIGDRKALVSQSEQTQKQFTELMKELDEIARGGDKDAQQIIATYGIKVADNQPAGGGTTTPPGKKEEPKAPVREPKTP
jgi:uncharacterized protein HemX